MIRQPPRPPLFPTTTPFRPQVIPPADADIEKRMAGLGPLARVPVAAAGSPLITRHGDEIAEAYLAAIVAAAGPAVPGAAERSEEHTPELPSQPNLVCRLLLG